ncbi:hypothetical protein [Shewanella nanhaiensis]|uniref:Uncharacterized protein n=1 Tax=Shewanella nanhaiensis TaxID=2864872 RepID=A0ABS7E3M1_9GAMM|nr:hypothetical protein [Shewanella nanhaiensis]MBW8184189.1 hypothetical protein [Shewanella nanhaiensis]
MLRITILSICLTFMIACSSISTVKNPSADNLDGLIYYMPKKDFIAQVVIEKENGETKVESIDIVTSAAYPDLSAPYILRFNDSLFGKNKLIVKVSSNGLLTSSNASYTSQVQEALEKLSSSVGGLNNILMNFPDTIKDKCSEPRIYRKIIKLGSPALLCGISFEVTPAQTVKQLYQAGIDTSTNVELSGYFYRQEAPFIGTINKEDSYSDTYSTSKLLFSPSYSPDRFLPVSKTFFSTNSSNITFNDGTLIQYTQNTDSELLAFFGIPAAILKEYFTAVGTVFDAFSSNDKKEITALQQELLLEFEKVKIEKCLEAINNEDKEAIAELECK